MCRGRGTGAPASGCSDAVSLPLLCLERLVCVVKRRAGVDYLPGRPMQCCILYAQRAGGRAVIARVPVNGFAGRMQCCRIPTSGHRHLRKLGRPASRW